MAAGTAIADVQDQGLSSHFPFPHIPPTMQTPPPAGPVDPDDEGSLQVWLDYFGVTAQQLREAVNAAGSDPQAVTEHLLHQGSSAGPG